MTADRRAKRRVRSRMAKTGESYSAALRHLRHTEENVMPHHHLRPGAATDTGNVRTSNQDRFTIDARLVAVADGMGGHEGGEIASELALAALESAFAAAPTADGLENAAGAANLAVFERSLAEPSLAGMGTTLAALAITTSDGGEDRIAVLNVGDSRAYLFRDGNLSRLTKDHTVVAELVDRGVLDAEAASSHPHRHVLTRVVGVAQGVATDLTLLPACQGDRVLLCSDGLTNELSDIEISVTLADLADPEACAAQLVRLAKERRGADNITAVVVDLDVSSA